MLEELKSLVLEADLQLVRQGLVMETFGNVSGVDRAGGHVVIKPSGLPYDKMSAGDMVVVSLADGRVVDGALAPSSDTPTHLELYRSFPLIGGIVHTHSFYATAWAQARRDVPPLGTTHADHFPGPIPCTRPLSDEEIAGPYEVNTGRAIVERFARLDPMRTPAVLVASHGPFAWGTDAIQAVRNAAMLEYLCRLAAETLRIEPAAGPISQALLDRHFNRKHGSSATYGQRKR